MAIKIPNRLKDLTVVLSILFILFVFAYPSIIINKIINMNEDTTEEEVSSLIDYEATKNNIYNRVTTANDTEEKLSEVRYSLNNTIDPERILNLFIKIKQVKIDKQLEDKPITIKYKYISINQFSMNIEFEGKNKKIIFSRYGLFDWKITDILFDKDFNFFF